MNRSFWQDALTNYVNTSRQCYRRFRRIVRALQGQDLWQGEQLDCDKVYLGNDGKCWCVCPEGLSGTSVAYCIGVGEDISFDLELIGRFGLQVHAFDPTPRSIHWVGSQSLPEKFVFHPYGVADYDGTCRFLPPKNPVHVSHTMLQRSVPGPAIELTVHRLSFMMKTLGHDEIDILKMDIEGAEYGVLTDLLACGIAARQLLVEFHHRWPEVGIEKTRQAIWELNRVGYRIFHVSPSGEEYSFKRIVAP